MENKTDIYTDKLLYYIDVNNLDKMSKYIVKLNNINNINYKNENALFLRNNILVGGQLYYLLVINKYYNVLDYITEKEYQDNVQYIEQINDKFKNVDKKIIIKTIDDLIHKNLKNMIHTIDKNGGKNKYYHISIRPIEEIYDSDTLSGSLMGDDSIYNNPYGLWLSCGSEWMKFIKQSDYKWTIATYIYEITVSNNVLKISNLRGLKKFIEKYKNSDKILSIENVINWTRVKKEYDGLIICPYLGDEIWGKYSNELSIVAKNTFGNAKGPGPKVMFNDYIKKIIGSKWKNNIFFLTEWYRHWEVGSGVIWRKKGVADFTLFKKLDTFNSLL